MATSKAFDSGGSPVIEFLRHPRKQAHHFLFLAFDVVMQADRNGYDYEITSEKEPVSSWNIGWSWALLHLTMLGLNIRSKTSCEGYLDLRKFTKYKYKTRNGSCLSDANKRSVRRIMSSTLRRSWGWFGVQSNALRTMFLSSSEPSVSNHAAD